MKRITRKERVLNYINLYMNHLNKTENIKGVCSEEISKHLNIPRNEVSRILNQLYKEDKLCKIKGKPVYYYPKDNLQGKNELSNTALNVFENLIGWNGSLKNAIKTATAALMYPPSGLNMIIVGPSGVGKTLFAQTLGKFAKSIGKTNKDVVIFNCSSYANNPQLLMSTLFGHKKGAYTGADSDNPGLIELSNNGILFLDEVHSLPPEGQEMLFTLMDNGTYRRLGETQNLRKANVLFIFATTKPLEETFLPTFLRRIPIVLELPSLKDRPIEERFALIKYYFTKEFKKLGINKSLIISKDVINVFLAYDWPANIGELEKEIKKICSQLIFKATPELKYIYVSLDDLSEHLLNITLNPNQLLIKEDLKIEFNDILFSELNDDDIFNNFFLRNIIPEDSKSLSPAQIVQKMSENAALFMEKYLPKFQQLDSPNLQYQDLLKIIKQYYFEATGFNLGRLGETFFKTYFHYRCKIKQPNFKLYHKNKLASYLKKTGENDYNLSTDILNFICKKNKCKFYLEDKIILCIFIKYFKKLENNLFKVFIIGERANDNEAKIATTVRQLTGANNISYIPYQNIKSLNELARSISESIGHSYKGGLLLLSPDSLKTIVERELTNRIEKPVKLVVNKVTASIAILAATKTHEMRFNRNLELIASDLKRNYQLNMIKKHPISQAHLFVICCNYAEPLLTKIEDQIEKLLPHLDISTDMINFIRIAPNKINLMDIYIEKYKDSIAAILDCFGLSQIPENIIYKPFWSLFYSIEKTSENYLENLDRELLKNFLTFLDLDKGIEIFNSFLNNLTKNLDEEFATKNINMKALFINFLFMLERFFSNTNLQYHPHSHNLAAFNKLYDAINSSIKETLKRFPFGYCESEILHILYTIVTSHPALH